jgi:hypothetical protein
MEFIGEIIAYIIWEYIILGIAKLIMGIGALVFSLFSLFRVSPKEHFFTESFDKKVGMFWTGLLVIVLIILAYFKFKFI